MRIALLALAWFALVVGALHLSVTDPYRVYCEDIENGFLPQTAYTYRHPREAFEGRPTPSCNFGTANYLTDGRPAALLPIAATLLGRAAPRDPWNLALFEWRATRLFLLASMAALFLFLRRAGADAALAAAVASCYPFAFTVFYEWRHPDLLRGRVLIAPVVLGLWAATRRGGYRGWLLLAGAVVVCMAQAAQLYWVGALVAYWIADSAWLDRRLLLARIRTLGPRVVRYALPPLVALVLVALALAPIYLRGQAVMRDSAFFQEFDRDPGHFFYYLRDGRSWFSLVELTTLERGFLPWSLAGLSLLGGVFLWRRGRGGFADWPDDARRLVVLGLPLFAGSLLLSFVPHLPSELFAVRDGRVHWAFAPLAVPTAFAVVFHTTVRTWLVLAEIGGLLAGVGALAAWSASPRSVRDRGGELAASLALFAAVSAAIGLASGGAWPEPGHWRALAAIAGVYAAVALTASCAGRPRRLAQAATLALGALLATHAAASHYEAGKRRCSRGVTDALVELRRDQAILARVPDEVRNQRQYRLFGDKWCYYLDAPCALSYGLRTLPSDVVRFFRAIGAVRDVRLPYWLHLDYAMLLESGIAQMLGIRWWILPADILESGPLLTDEGDVGPPLRLLEAKGAFAKGWALESWETAASFDDAAARVVALGRAGELGRRGVVQTREEGPLDSPDGSGAPADGGAPSAELVSAEPGALLFRVRSDAGTILATNEFFHRAWTAEIAGRPAPVVRVNAAFAGVEVPAGAHQVRLAR